MANHLDLEEQEQIEQLKHFWNTWGSLITGVLVVVFAAVAGWNGYQYWQQRQAAKASAMSSVVSQALAAKDLDRASQALAELEKEYGSTLQAQQAALQLAKAAVEADKLDEAKAALTWVAEKGSEGLQGLAKLRLSAVLQQQDQLDEALKALDGKLPEAYAALVADRRGDLLSAQGKGEQAVAEYQRAHAAFEKGSEYARLVEFKLNALGAEPTGQTPTAEKQS
ncbi:YfgM family protein [Comamonas composti]|uniref:YfgM family protein n=1 Tax=Comamonas composti TaxID=408558 RepID=UPI0004251A75|nr:tetratricopeptide repeat protein [Comamonas composti]